MIRVTAALILHRPERYLFYLPEVSEHTKQCITDGLCPPILENYCNDFGTYDDVGVFYLSPELQLLTGEKYVVGIEYRKDDERVKYPQDLPYVILPECNIVSKDVAYEYQLSEEVLEEIIYRVSRMKDSRDGDYRLEQDGLIAAFYSNGKLRIMSEVELIEKKGNYLCTDVSAYSREELYRMAFHEPITGFYNWTWMWECLSSYHRYGIVDYGFVHFDIKDFKMINELYNHQVGNAVLQRVTKNIEANSDWIYFGARCDNDNFALMIHDMPEEETRMKLEQFFDAISWLEEDPEYPIYYRCGVVCMRNAMNTGDVVADCAKLAQATGTTLNVTEIQFYTNEMHEDILWGKQLKAYLDTAIRANEFFICLQPKVNLVTESICGAEALVRWHYKHKEILTPYRFISHLESDDSIIKVDDVVLHRVCAKLREWKEKGYPLFPISVNLSRKHMERPYLVAQLTGIVDSYGVDHSLIEFELTESVAYDNQKYLVSVMNELRNKGFLISMDDFGTGYSSFGLLGEMPLDTLKIDKSFVDLISLKEQECDKNLIILEHIISMAKALGINCIAEGVEEHEQVLMLQKLGCEYIQGYYYSKPVRASIFEDKYLKQERV